MSNRMSGMKASTAKAQAPSSLPHAELLLQRKCACGSPTQSMSGECAECQGKKLQRSPLAIGSPDDRFEQEADRVADAVVKREVQLEMPKPTFRFTPPTMLGDQLKHKLPGEQKKKEDEPVLQRKTGETMTGLIGNDAAPPIVHDVLRSPGQQLDAATRAFMEPRFGVDFSQVRVHTDATAEQSALEVSATAYTVGHNVVFGSGRLDLKTHEGRHLLAHELTHVVQQSRGKPTSSVTPDDGPLEEEANRTANAIEDRQSVVTVTGASAPSLARQAISGGAKTYAPPTFEVLKVITQMEGDLAAARATAPAAATIQAEALRTFAVIKVVDANGKVKMSASGAFWETSTGLAMHAEKVAAKQLDLSVLEATDTVLIMVDQVPCIGKGSCTEFLKRLKNKTAAGIRVLTRASVDAATRIALSPKSTALGAASTNPVELVEFLELHKAPATGSSIESASVETIGPKMQAPTLKMPKMEAKIEGFKAEALHPEAGPKSPGEVTSNVSAVKASAVAEAEMSAVKASAAAEAEAVGVASTKSGLKGGLINWAPLIFEFAKYLYRKEEITEELNGLMNQVNERASELLKSYKPADTHDAIVVNFSIISTYDTGIGPLLPGDIGPFPASEYSDATYRSSTLHSVSLSDKAQNYTEFSTVGPDESRPPGRQMLVKQVKRNLTATIKYRTRSMLAVPAAEVKPSRPATETATPKDRPRFMLADLVAEVKPGRPATEYASLVEQALQPLTGELGSLPIARDVLNKLSLADMIKTMQILKTKGLFDLLTGLGGRPGFVHKIVKMLARPKSPSSIEMQEVNESMNALGFTVADKDLVRSLL